ncbi:MAG TPA: LemA family protein [Planctomycetota bacterium]|nr:LemA family protein [Planctomycetota bacterium]
MVWIIPLAVVGIFVLWAIATYNGLVSRRNETKNSWSQIDVQLKRRYELIPNLVETVKGYMKHERETLEAVIRARQTCVDFKNAGNIAELVKAEGALTQSLRGLFAVAENYPDLKANQNMLSLQEELKSTENRVGFARQAYNDAVMRLNNAIEMFPGSVIAGMGNFKQAVFFEVEAAEERKAVKVSF